VCQRVTAPVEEIRAHQRDADDGDLLVTIADEAQTTLYRVDPAAGAERTFEAQGDDRGVLTFDLQDGTLALLVTHPNEGLDLYAMPVDDVDAADPDLARLTDRNAALRAEHPMPDCRWVSFENDGHELDGVLYTPPDADLDGDEFYTLVLSIHGGPVSYDEPEFSFEFAAWTSRGYLVFCPNYRGGMSYGREFIAELVGRWGTV
jgi:dipeptidyl aminopeptidase/acylaminoacyl peptidase